MCPRTPSETPGDPDRAIADAAARWLARRDRGLSRDEETMLRRWRAADPRHAAELERLEREWRGFDLAKDSGELSALAADLDRDTRRASRARWPAWAGTLAAAAGFAVVAGIIGWRSNWPAGPETTAIAPSYQVLASTASRLTLEDGSVAEVRGDSELRSEYSAHERRVRLLRGEAHFTVVKDAARPFVVSAGDTAVRAIGTAFNVRLDRGRIEVLVTEGKVQVADAGPSGLVEPEAPMVSAGHRAVVESSGPGGVAAARAKVEITAAAPAEMDQALAWQTTRLVFDRTPLAEAVDAFNRHAAPTGMRLAIGDSKLRARRMGGSFRAANMEAFVRLLEQSVEVRAERRGDLVVLLPVE